MLSEFLLGLCQDYASFHSNLYIDPKKISEYYFVNIKYKIL